MSMTTPTNTHHTHRPVRAIALAIATIISFATFGAVQANATPRQHPCGHGIDTSTAPVIRWGWQYNDVHYIETPLGDVGVWTNRHGHIIGYAAHEDTNIMPSAMCAARDL